MLDGPPDVERLAAIAGRPRHHAPRPARDARRREPPRAATRVGSNSGHEVEQARERQADDVEVVALDARDEHGAGALDGVAARAALPLAASRRTSRSAPRSRARKWTLGDLDRGVGERRRRGRRRSPPTTSWVRPARRATNSRAWSASRGLPRMSPSRATSVSAPSVSAAARDRQRLAARVLLGDGDRVAVGLLLDARDADGERDADLLEDRAPLRRRAREDQSSGKNSAASRWPDSGESEPWTMFGADGDREVAADRAGGGLERVGGADDLAGGADRVLALEDERDDRAGGDELDELAEERLALVLAVVLLGEVLGRPSCAWRRRSSGPCARSGR